MRTFAVWSRILGGEWSIAQFGGKRAEFSTMEEALGVEATLKDPIRETMVISIDQQATMTDGAYFIKKTYEIVG